MQGTMSKKKKAVNRVTNILSHNVTISLFPISMWSSFTSHCAFMHACFEGHFIVLNSKPVMSGICDYLKETLIR